MRMRYVAVAMACAALMVATPAYSAEIITGSELYRRCTAAKGSSEHTYCAGFILGAPSGYRKLCRMEKEPALDGAQPFDNREVYERPSGASK